MGNQQMARKIPKYAIKYLIKTPNGGSSPEAFSEDLSKKVLHFHRLLPAYQPTRLIRLRNLARSWGVAEILIKDESTRFGLGAFKVLGGSYAVARLLCQKLGFDIQTIDFDCLTNDAVRKRVGHIILATATDGNHGRGVAWAAEQLGLRAMIYMPKGTAPLRVENIRCHGATVEVTPLNYDDTVRLCSRRARENGWHVIQDTAWDGYEDIPRWIMQGYMTMCVEAVSQMREHGVHRPTHFFIQAGVGAFDAAMVGYLARLFQDDMPCFIIMEPNNAACLFSSAIAGKYPSMTIK